MSATGHARLRHLESGPGIDLLTDTGFAINRALTFLANQQNRDGGFDIAAGAKRRSDVRASTQIVGGLVGASLGTLHSGGARPHR